MQSHRQILVNPVRLKCHRCDNDWTYKGKNPYYACCTHCKATVSVRKQKQDQKIVVQDSTHDQLSPVTAAANTITTTITEEDQEGYLSQRHDYQQQRQ
jgi:hypothetical protein